MAEYLKMEGLAPDFLRTADHAAFHLLAARDGGELVAAALAYDFGDDCGSTTSARSRGPGGAAWAPR